MKKILALLTLLSSALQCAENIHPIYHLRQHTDADWVVVGAGPAGIATIGVLIDVGVKPERIVWIDPEFNVGRIGQYYENVPGNTRTHLFVDFVQACNIFREVSSPAIDRLQAADPLSFETLKIVLDPLIDITAHIRTKVNDISDVMTSLYFDNDLWHVGTHNSTITTHHVVLATGSRPKTLSYETQEVIPLDIAIDQPSLANIVVPNDTVGVVGGSHSAILLLKFLSEMPVHHIYNFYKKPLLYAVDMGDWTLYDGTGLKGATAEWARNVLEKNPPANLTRLKSTPEILQEFLPQCTKTVYAVGYERNELPAINGTQPITDYDEAHGFIAPRLFGIGIAFPEIYEDPLGNEDVSVGLTGFMEYAQEMIPEWMNNEEFRSSRLERFRAQLKKLRAFETLFTINLL